MQALFDNPSTLPMLLGALMVSFVIAMFLLSSKRKKNWQQALDRLAQHYRLQFHKSDYAQGSHVSGDTEREHALSVRWTEESRFGSDNSTHYVEIKIDPRDYGNARICEAGSWEPQTVDYSGDGDKKVLLGDASFDKRFDIWNPSKRDLRRLKDPATRMALVQFLDSGGVVEFGSLILKSREFPKDPDDLIKQVAPILELAEKMSA